MLSPHWLHSLAPFLWRPHAWAETLRLWIPCWLGYTGPCQLPPHWLFFGPSRPALFPVCLTMQGSLVCSGGRALVLILHDPGGPPAVPPQTPPSCPSQTLRSSVDQSSATLPSSSLDKAEQQQVCAIIPPPGGTHSPVRTASPSS